MTRDDQHQPAPVPPGRSMRPRDAAALVILDSSTGEPRILMGRRRADLVFLPNKFVFPGGRVDRADYTAPSADELPGREVGKLNMEPRGERSAARPRALALAALRETYEEAGLLIGTQSASARRSASDSWAAIHAYGVIPRLSGLTYFARAITPPGRARRYDTRFFCIDASEIAGRVDAPSGELSCLNWFGLDEMRGLELPGITRVVVEDLADWLDAGLPAAYDLPVPFYFHRNGSFERMLLKTGAA